MRFPVRFVLLAVAVLAFARVCRAETWSFAVFGDTRSPSSSPGVNTTALNGIVTDIVNNRNCSFALVVGDLTYSGSSSQYALFQDTMNASGMKLCGSSGSGIEYYPVRGNHEGSNTTRWRLYFGSLPQNGPTTASGGGGNSEAGMTYNFTHNNAAILALDEYINTAHRLNNNWANQTLANTTQQHVFAFGHDPAYQVSHSDCLAQDQSRRDDFLTNLYNAGGHFYFAGHDHLTAVGRIYEKNPSSGGTQGMYQVIVGSGGAPVYIFDGVYNADYPGDYAVADLYHDSDPVAWIDQHIAYAVVTVADNAEWLKIYGTTSLTADNWGLLYQMVAGGDLVTDTNAVNGNITVESGITFNQTFDATFTGVVSGPGTLTKAGNSTLTLSADNTLTGATTVSGGALIITGASSSTNVLVSAGSGFGGTGTVKSLTNYGTVRPGNSIGTLNLNGGAYSQSSSGVLEIEVASVSSYDKIVGCSNAQLSGTLKTITTGSYAVGDTLSGVIETSGAVTGSFAALETAITPTIVWKPQVNGSNLDLIVTRDYNNEVLRATLTESQKQVAAAVQTLFSQPGADAAAVKAAIDNLDTAQKVADAYSQLSAEKLGGIPDLSFSASGVQLSNVNSHFAALRSGRGERFAFNPLSGSFNAQIDRVLLAYNGDDWAKFLPQDAARLQKDARWQIFLNGHGDFADQQTSSVMAGYQYSSGALTGGLDYLLAKGLVAGMHGGYTRTVSVMGGSGGEIEVDSASCGLHLAYSGGPFYLTGVADYAANFYRTERIIEIGELKRQADSDTCGKQWSAGVTGGYDFSFRSVATGPFASLRYSRFVMDDFTEEGAGSLNLAVADQRDESLQLGIGWRVEWGIRAGKKTFLPRLQASYQFECADESRLIDARLAQGSDSLQAEIGRPGGDDFMLFGCGIGMALNDSMSVDVGYEMQPQQHGFSAQSVNGRLSIAF